LCCRRSVRLVVSVRMNFVALGAFAAEAGCTWTIHVGVPWNVSVGYTRASELNDLRSDGARLLAESQSDSLIREGARQV
jgi:hypothetical protein